MEPITGKNVTIQFVKGDDYYDYACATDISIDFSLESKPVRTYGDGTWNKPRGQRHSYSISLSGLVVFDEPTLPGAFDILEYLRSMAGVQYRMFFDEPISNTLKLIEGVALPVKVSLGGGAEGFAQGNIEMEGDGNVSIRDAIINCPSTITTIELNEAQTAILITGHTGEPIRYDYSIDGGGFDTAFIFTDPAEIPLPDGLAVGEHTITIIPVCENGDNGTEFTDTFTIEEAPDVCSPPTALVFSAITETTATVSWTAPGTPPADGYEWEIEDTATGGTSFSDSGTSTDTDVDLTGLSEGVEYTFRVRSKCGEGDFSTWLEDTFETITEEETATFDWAFSEILGASGSLFIQGDTAPIYLLQTSNGSGSIIIDPIEPVLVRVTGSSGTTRHLLVEDDTTSTIIYNSSGTSNQEITFTPTAGHLYNIIAQITP